MKDVRVTLGILTSERIKEVRKRVSERGEGDIGNTD